MATEIESQAIRDNCNDYKSWSSIDTAEWIISIDSSKFEKYREELNKSFADKNIDFESIVDVEDLKQYGIIDLEDRKTIYTSITQLIATQKSSKESQDTQTFDIGDTEIEITQLSASDGNEDDEGEIEYSQGVQSSSPDTENEDEKKSIEEDYNLEVQRQNLMDNGYCKWISDKSYKDIMITLTSGYVHEYYEADHQFPLKLNQDIFRVIREFYGITFGIGDHDHVKLQINYLGTDHLYLTTVTNISLSSVLNARLEASDSNVITVDKVPCDTLEHMLMYLGHHKGVEPDPLPCPVRSIHMNQIVSDKWDATWIDAFDKKTIFEIILAAHHLDITCLLHLGSAKIATLIKQLDQKEINRIIEEEEKYRREHAANNNDDANDSDDEDQKQPSLTITGPSIVMLDELVSIFDHEYNDQIEDDEENDNDQRIQGIDDEMDKVKMKEAQNDEERIMNPRIVMLDELLSIFD